LFPKLAAPNEEGGDPSVPDEDKKKIKRRYSQSP